MSTLTNYPLAYGLFNPTFLRQPKPFNLSVHCRSRFSNFFFRWNS